MLRFVWGAFYLLRPFPFLRFASMGSKGTVDCPLEIAILYNTNYIFAMPSRAFGYPRSTSLESLFTSSSAQASFISFSPLVFKPDNSICFQNVFKPAEDYARRVSH
jgi:hypothetical protein